MLYYRIYVALRHTQLLPFYHKFTSLFNAHTMCMKYMGNLFPIYCEPWHSQTESLLEYSTVYKMLMWK